MKKVNLRFLAVLPALLLLAFGSKAANYDFMVNGLAYQIVYDGAGVRVTPTSYDGNNYAGLTAANIPAKVTYNGTTYPVMEIAAAAFKNSPIKTVTIAASATHIYDSGFSNCAQLTTVNIGNSVTYIGKKCFYDCPALTKVTIGNKLATIDNYAFEDCTALNSITLPASLTTIGMCAFKNCKGLTAITIPASVSALQESWFINCTSLKTVTWNATACANAPDPNFINVPSPPFAGCTALTTFNFGSNVTRIPDYLCWEQAGITSLTIPASVSYVGRSAFYNCTGLKTLNWNAKETNDFKISTWYGTLPFFQCENLEKVTFGGTVEKIPAYLCFKCSKVSSVNFPNTLKSIGWEAFLGTGLKSVTIPSSVTNVTAGAFTGCDSLKHVTWDVVEHVNYGGYDDTPFFHLAGGVAKPNLTSITLGSHVKKVPNYLFSNMSGVTELALPEGVTEVGAYAFAGVPATVLNLPSSLTRVNDYAFNAAKVPSLTLPEGLTYVGRFAFAGCPLTELHIPAALADIGTRAFNASKLMSVTVDPNNPIYDSRENCNAVIRTSSNAIILGSNVATILPTVTRIGDYAFAGCPFTSINIPASVTTIGSYAFSESGLTSLPSLPSVTAINEGAFSSCYKLKNISLPSSVKTIGSVAFRNCLNLETLILSDSITSIGARAFGGCDKMNAIKSFIAHPDNVNYGSDVFQYFVTSRCRLLVPVGTTDIYRSTTPWKKFAIEEFVAGDINADGVINGADVTALYNVLFNNEDRYVVDGDVNNDNTLNGADVTTLYELLFTGN